MIEISEIYETIQGETTRVGAPCVIVRLARCGLRCSWCDSEYALVSGESISLEETLTRIFASPLPLVILTGGEPLRQAETPELARRLLEAGRDVLVETNGVEEIGLLDERAIVIMDIKCPSSGESGKTLAANIERLRPTDEVKFVIATQEDYAWAKAAIERHDLARRAIILFSWANADGISAAGRIGLAELAEAVVRDRLPVRVIPQLHKVIWGDDARGR
jgi:7-carboxy-7-deazaguanine synthase